MIQPSERGGGWRPFAGVWLAAGGSAAVVAALFADPLGLATQTAFGWKRQLLLVLGAAAIGVAAWLLAPAIRAARAAPPSSRENAVAKARRLHREHRGLGILLLLAVGVRALVAASYWPGLLWGDSWTYADMAVRGAPVLAAPYPQSGYPLAIHLISLPGRNVAAIVTIQHLAGLLTGVLVYATLVRLGARRWVALAAATLVLLSAGSVLLEQRVLSETFFSLALMGAAFLTVATRRGPAALALAALLIAWAVTLRTAGLFVVPVWLAYVLVARRPAGARQHGGVPRAAARRLRVLVPPGHRHVRLHAVRRLVPVRPRGGDRRLQARSRARGDARPLQHRDAAPQPQDPRGLRVGPRTHPRGTHTTCSTPTWRGADMATRPCGSSRSR